MLLALLTLASPQANVFKVLSHGISTAEFIEELDQPSYLTAGHDPYRRELPATKRPWGNPVDNFLVIAIDRLEFAPDRLQKKHA